MKFKRCIRCAFTLIATGILPLTANAADPAASNWQTTRLFNPTQADVVREEKGRVMIYNGLTDKTVEKALEKQFHRVESMMFLGTVVTDDRGEPAVDPDTGNIITEEDGCD